MTDTEKKGLFTPTEEQRKLLARFEVFLKSPEPRSSFLLRGYAGTGKTTMMRKKIEMLAPHRLKYVLLAPTGRAAKVLSAYTGKTASTIHKKIYFQRGALHSLSFALGKNLHTNTLFIVDEASMIAGQVLDDLIKYIFDGINCKLLFIGDKAQLPPVGLKFSPALDAAHLKEKYALHINEFELTKVVRQEALSGILENATRIRALIGENLDEEESESAYPSIVTAGYKDTFKMNGDKLEDGINYAYKNYGIENTLIICRSNRAANAFNRQIRSRILFQEEEINTKDYVMVVKNNYFWLPENSQIGFIANGDIARINRLKNVEEQFGFKFADARMNLIDYPEAPELEAKVMLDTLSSETSSLDATSLKTLSEAILESYDYLASKKEKMKQLREDPYWNALQIKFSYAVTCHKAQGGQWKAVFVDQGYLTDEMVNQEFIRWLYTASTRAVKELYYVNFDTRFFEK